MRALVVWTLALMCGLQASAQGIWLANYQRACEQWEDESVARAFLEFVRETPLSGISEPEAVAFRAAAEMMAANHGWNPLEQWNVFVTWRAALEEAVMDAPDEPNVRLVRFGIQENAPRFLGYSHEIEEDRGRCFEALRAGVWAAHPDFENFVRESLSLIP